MIGTILIFLLIFFIIVLGHEFGHFLIAKVNGIRVNEFTIGMGPRIAGFQKGETEYVLRAFPLGGACIFEGEDGLESAEGISDEGNFQNAPVWARIGTVIAGPLFNFLLAFLFAVMVAGYAGADIPVLGGVTEGSAAEAAGMQAGDKIVRFNSKVCLAREISLEMALNRDGSPVEVAYERDGKTYETVLTPKYDETLGRYLVGFENYAMYQEAKGFNLFRYGWYQLRFSIKNSVTSVTALVQGKLTRDDVAGPVGMAQIVDEVKEASAPGGPMLVFMNMVNLAMLLSVSLGVMNLLPVPALDGGRLVFLLIEVIRGKPVSPEKEGMIHFAGYVMLLIVMVFVLFNDIQRLLR
ncbi:MAG: RIP metalloprotease RseP [Eisenbergiella sp.]